MARPKGSTKLRNAKTAEEALDDKETVVKLPSSTKIKLHKEAIKRLMEKRNTQRQTIKNTTGEINGQYEKATNDGISKKELKAAIESELHPVSDSHKFLVNHYRQADDQPDLFVVPEHITGEVSGPEEEQEEGAEDAA